MTVPLCIGIDPGLVHTGVVGLRINTDTKDFRVLYALVDGIDDKKVMAAVHKISQVCSYSKRYIWIEEYRPRSHLSTDQRMVEGVAAIKSALHESVVLPNTGIKTVVKPALLQLLRLDTYSVSTHHDDLRSAARILLLGMLKDDELNALLTEIVLDSWMPDRSFLWNIDLINLT